MRAPVVSEHNAHQRQRRWQGRRTQRVAREQGEALFLG